MVLLLPVSVCVCVYYLFVCVCYLFVCVCVCVCATFVCVSVCVCTCIVMCSCICVCMRICLSEYHCVWVSVTACVCVCGHSSVCTLYIMVTNELNMAKLALGTFSDLEVIQIYSKDVIYCRATAFACLHGANISHKRRGSINTRLYALIHPPPTHPLPHTSIARKIIFNCNLYW